MADPEHLKILQQSVEAWTKWRAEHPEHPVSTSKHLVVQVWNTWRREHPEIRPDLRGADLVGARISEIDFNGVNLREADLRDASLINADLADADLFGANLVGANLTTANLHGANLRGAKLAHATLSRASLGNADLSNADLGNADLISTNLRGAKLIGANLSGAHLSEASLFGADLFGADLHCADMRGADLRGAKLFSANLIETKLSDARLGETVFAGSDLSAAKGLEKVKHLAPSSIGVDTLYVSAGKIPDEFLRGVGIPDVFIEYTRALFGREPAIQFYSCFISYSTHDEEFARRLHSRLRDEHVRVWFALEDMEGGKKLHEQIDEAIRGYDKLLVVLSEQSIVSEWVRTEIRRACKAEAKEKRRKLFPVALVDYETLKGWEFFDADLGKDLAAEVREYYIPGFQNWKDHDAFEAAFKKLLKALKTE
ncbi:MAG: toll/interleukin-1 receptor domain-containing protein [Verrucomicrobia bacterium]|nr:toll/interleukin-1 receptor domain-containing protein [Verrucomicrobiota bacterium]